MGALGYVLSYPEEEKYDFKNEYVDVEYRDEN